MDLTKIDKPFGELHDAWNRRADPRDEVIARLVGALEAYKQRSKRIPFDLAVSSDAAIAAAKDVLK